MSPQSILRDPVTLVWAVLMLATVASTWWLSKDAVAPMTGSIAIFLIAGWKVRLVLLWFMELRHAPRPWRIVFELWVAAATLAVLGLYLKTAIG